MSFLPVTREALGYLEPKRQGLADDFAQCGHCFLFDRKDRCAIHGPDLEIKASYSCIYFAMGAWCGARIAKLLTPKETQLVRHKVRCENCRFAKAGICRLYATINHLLPAIFRLDTKIEAKACCNLQTPRDAVKA